MSDVNEDQLWNEDDTMSIAAAIELSKSQGAAVQGKHDQQGLPDEGADASNSASSSSSLSMAQQARMERHRLKALSLKQARLQKRPTPYAKSDEPVRTVTGDVFEGKTVKETKLVDSGAGFFIEEGEENEEAKQVKLSELPAPIVEEDRPMCLECQKPLADSFLFRTFDVSVCDNCKETEKDGKHELITKTDAKNIFLLKDYDLEKREPSLKFIVRKNPHNVRWGDMKLYLRSQIEARALDVWGTEEALERAHVERDAKREKSKTKKFNKQIKALRMQVRGSLYKKDLGGHQHEFGEEQYDEDADEYLKQCNTCDFITRYEKM